MYYSQLALITPMTTCSLRDKRCEFRRLADGSPERELFTHVYVYGL